MESRVQPNPSDEERILAALAHAGIIANGFNLLGLVGAALIWTTQRERSRFVARHALQALVFQAASLLLVLLMLCAWGGCIMVSLLPAILRPELYRSSPPTLFWLALLLGLGVAALGAAGAIYGLVGAWSAWRGRPFRYALLGRLVEARTSDRQESGAGGQESGARSQEPGSGSQEPGGEGQESAVKSQEPGGARQEPGAEGEHTDDSIAQAEVRAETADDSLEQAEIKRQ